MKKKDIALGRTEVEEKAFTEAVLRDLAVRDQDPIIIIRPGNSVKLSFQKDKHQIAKEEKDPDYKNRILRVFSADPKKEDDGRNVSSITIYGTNNKVVFEPGEDGMFTLVISYAKEKP